MYKYILSTILHILKHTRVDLLHNLLSDKPGGFKLLLFLANQQSSFSSESISKLEL